MMGMFINTVPTRVTVHGGQSVVSWLAGLQEREVESRNYDFVSLAQVQGWSDLPGGVNLFDSAVVFENYPIGDTSAEARIQAREIELVDTTNFPLTLSAFLDDRLRFDLGYDPA